MALPTKEKTWLYSVNQAVGDGGNVTTANRDFIFKLKEALIGFASNPWTVWGSCDSSNVDNGGGTDYWVDRGDLIWNTAGNAHSWIVLKQGGLGANVYLCIDLDRTTTGYQFDLVLALDAPFNTDGTTTNRPTTSGNAITRGALYHGGYNSSGWTGFMHVWQSNDGACTRYVLTRSGAVYGFMFIDVVKDPFTAWSPAVVFGQLGDDGTSGHITFQDWNDNARAYGRVGSNFTMYLTCEGWSSSVGCEFGVADEDTGEWPIMPIGLASETVGFRGAHKGSLYDMWWGSTVLNTGDTYPDNATKQFVLFDDMVFPWNGSTPLIA
ncbi:MAG: hypothetical protein DRJ03_27865 [Chloroflexi bacterium]|nr:MAG: hypothetical protein DRJ03_27865 [Chloroflexota bacterium]